jgi:hypothetical protein
LRRNCVYTDDGSSVRYATFLPATGGIRKSPLKIPQLKANEGSLMSKAASASISTEVALATRSLDLGNDNYNLGISKPLVFKLVEAYFENAYNASLLLHKASFMGSLRDDSANPHIVLSVCAWAAKYF